MNNSNRLRICLFNKYADLIFEMILFFVAITPLVVHLLNNLLTRVDKIGTWYKIIYLPFFLLVFFFSPIGGLVAPGFMKRWLLRKGDFVKIVKGVTSVNMEIFSFTMEYEFGQVLSIRSKPLSWRRAIDVLLNMGRTCIDNSRYRHYAEVSIGGKRLEVAICDIAKIMTEYAEHLTWYKQQERFPGVE